MNELSIFDFETKPVRVVMLEEQPHWVATDISTILGYNHTPHMLRMLDDDQKGVHKVDTLGGAQELMIVTEGGMFTCVIRSKRPEAKRFLRWITDEVLPSIFRTGTYTMPGKDQPDFFAETANNLESADPARLTAAAAVVREARRLFGITFARAIWPKLGLPVPDITPAIDDGLAAALASWVQDKDRLTYADIGHGLGIGLPDATAKRRIADVLAAMGWTWRNTKFGSEQRWSWRKPLHAASGESVQ